MGDGLACSRYVSGVGTNQLGNVIAAAYLSGIRDFDVAGLANADAQLRLGSPLFDKITIQLNPDYYPGKTFTIETLGNNKENKFVQSYTLNGEALHQPSLSFKDLVKGGHLKMGMGNAPVDQY